MRTFQHLFFGYPAALFGTIIALTATDTSSAVTGAGLMICGTLALVTTPKNEH